MASDQRKMNFTLDGGESIAIVLGIKNRSVIKICVELLIVGTKSNDVDCYTSSCVFKNDSCTVSRVGHPDTLRFSDVDMIESDYTVSESEILFNVHNITRQVLQVDASIDIGRFPRVLHR